MPDRKADTPFYIALCERMRMARVHAEVTMEAVAHTLGTQMQRISKMERGDVRPRADIVAGYARMFDVDLDWLLMGDEEPRHLDVIAPPGKDKKLSLNDKPPGKVAQPEEKRVRAKIKKSPPPPPRPPQPDRPLWRPAGWSRKPATSTVGTATAEGGVDELSSAQRGA